MPSLAQVLAATAFIKATSAAVLDLPVTRNAGYSTVDLSLGTPGKTFSLMFDTGSSTAWVYDSVCAKDCPNYTSSKRPFVGYDTTASSTSHATGVYGQMVYLGGKTGGPAYTDAMSSGNVSWTQSFLAANSTTWAQMPADGFFGLAFSTIADANTTTIVETMMQQGKLDLARFGIVYLNTSQDNTDEAGLVTLGASREDEYSTGVIAEIPTQKSGASGSFELWRVNTYAVTGSHKKLNSSSSSNSSAVSTGPRISLPGGSFTVFDTGASAVSVPTNVIAPLYESIGMNWTAIVKGNHIPKCSEFTNDWSVTFEYTNGQNVTVTGDQLALPGFANQVDACWPPFDDSGMQDYFFLFGTRFLENFYTVYDFGSADPNFYSPTISFAPLKDGFKKQASA